MQIPSKEQFISMDKYEASYRYLNLASRTMNKELSPKQKQVNTFIGFNSEKHEIDDLVKKYLYQNKDLDKVKPKILEELGDVLWYWANSVVLIREVTDNTVYDNELIRFLSRSIFSTSVVYDDIHERKSKKRKERINYKNQLKAEHHNLVETYLCLPGNNITYPEITCDDNLEEQVRIQNNQMIQSLGNLFWLISKLFPNTEDNIQFNILEVMWNNINKLYKRHGESFNKDEANNRKG